MEEKQKRIKELENLLEKECKKYEKDCKTCPYAKECEEYEKLCNEQFQVSQRALEIIQCPLQCLEAREKENKYTQVYYRKENGENYVNIL